MSIGGTTREMPHNYINDKENTSLPEEPVESELFASLGHPETHVSEASSSSSSSGSLSSKEECSLPEALTEDSLFCSETPASAPSSASTSSSSRKRLTRLSSFVGTMPPSTGMSPKKQCLRLDQLTGNAGRTHAIALTELVRPFPTLLQGATHRAAYLHFFTRFDREGKLRSEQFYTTREYFRDADSRNDERARVYYGNLMTQYRSLTEECFGIAGVLSDNASIAVPPQEHRELEMKGTPAKKERRPLRAPAVNDLTRAEIADSRRQAARALFQKEFSKSDSS